MRRGLISTLCLVAFPLAACTANQGPSDMTSPADRPSPTADARVQWVDRYCGTTLSLTELVSRPLQTSGQDNAETKAALSQYLGDASSGLDRAITDMRELQQAPPEKAAGDAAKRTEETLTKIKQGMDDAKAKVDQADPANAEQFAEAIQAAGAEYTKQLGQFRDPTEELRVNRELERASQQAPKCRELSAKRTATPTSPTTPSPTG
ncbi:hypothetical protein GCM10012275_15070 [Longimycelium tulufanense]|uniref:Uncharacterized protein n=1 Tax=Longimycelium tulufanense TaxID=907463 RepID=A0A8J3CBL6_9PSEU|nr:hypothetical protein [Longimycelium tulufanense]GGM45009.1 hypothetical protein GCM10012275_15070 [Longimycelium tulufanense]